MKNSEISEKRRFKREAIQSGFQIKIPAYIDPVKLADNIKGGMTNAWLKRYNKYFKPKSHQAKQF